MAERGYPDSPNNAEKCMHGARDWRIDRPHIGRHDRGALALLRSRIETEGFWEKDIAAAQHWNSIQPHQFSANTT